MLGGFCILGFFEGLVGTFVPDHDGSCAVVSGGDDAFEIFVVEGMVFYLHGQSFIGGVERRAFGDGPAFQDAVHFQPEVIVEAGCGMFLHDEPQGFVIRIAALGSGVLVKDRFFLYSLSAMRE